MDRTLVAAGATVVVGSLIALQAPINSGLGKVTGTLPAAAISFRVGTGLLVGIVRGERRSSGKPRQGRGGEVVLPDRRACSGRRT